MKKTYFNNRRVYSAVDARELLQPETNQPNSALEERRASESAETNKNKESVAEKKATLERNERRSPEVRIYTPDYVLRQFGRGK